MAMKSGVRCMGLRLLRGGRGKKFRTSKEEPLIKSPHQDELRHAAGPFRRLVEEHEPQKGRCGRMSPREHAASIQQVASITVDILRDKIIGSCQSQAVADELLGQSYFPGLAESFLGHSGAIVLSWPPYLFNWMATVAPLDDLVWEALRALPGRVVHRTLELFELLRTPSATIQYDSRPLLRMLLDPVEIKRWLDTRGECTNQEIDFHVVLDHYAFLSFFFPNDLVILGAVRVNDFGRFW
ncbi:hypothetical protein DFH08DRAFT_943345 [Mycena albidolilacea]|uniref:Uncharacterized protein n=1 Tax=Mycena albidolilacea TaxID=1033008 RepID=A0AAD7ECZ3_9AGAR|nr:hypothetical protein DFH08DRAFT_943345 [Mycena albidolilacea]